MNRDIFHLSGKYSSRLCQNSLECIKSKLYSFQVQKFRSEVWLHAIYFAYERNSFVTFHINGPLHYNIKYTGKDDTSHRII